MSGAMESDVAAAVRFDEFDSLALKRFAVPEQMVRIGGPAERVDRRMLDEEDCVADFPRATRRMELALEAEPFRVWCQTPFDADGDAVVVRGHWEKKVQNKLTARMGGQLIALRVQKTGAKGYFAAVAAARRLAARDLRRFAVLRLMTPCLTALSRVEA